MRLLAAMGILAAFLVIPGAQAGPTGIGPVDYYIQECGQNPINQYCYEQVPLDYVWGAYDAAQNVLDCLEHVIRFEPPCQI